MAHLTDYLLPILQSCAGRGNQSDPELDERVQDHLKSTNNPWIVNETHIKVKGQKGIYIGQLIQKGIRPVFIQVNQGIKKAKTFFKKVLGLFYMFLNLVSSF